MNFKSLIIILFLSCLNYSDILSASTVNYKGVNYDVVDNGFSYEYLLSTRDANPIDPLNSDDVANSNIYRSSKDPVVGGERNVIRIVNGPLADPVKNREMLRRALEEDRGDGSSDRIVILKADVYRISDFLTLRGNTTLVGTTDGKGNRTTIELTPANEGPDFEKDSASGFNFQDPAWWPLTGIRPVIVVANTKKYYKQGDFVNYTESQRLQAIFSDEVVPSTGKTYQKTYGYFNDIYHVGLKNIDISIPASATGAIGVLWRTAQQCFIEDVNVNPANTTSEGGGIGGYAGFVAQGPGGGGHWKNCRITGTRYGVLGFVGQVTILGLSLNNISDIPICWSYIWGTPIFRDIKVNNCAHGLVFNGCASITILDSQINPPNASEFSPIMLLNPDWSKNVYLQNVKSSASHLVRKRIGPGVTLPNGSNSADLLATWEASRSGDTDHVPNQNGEARAHHWVSGSAVIDQVPYEEEELPTVHSSDFPGLDEASPTSNSKLIWYNKQPGLDNVDYTDSLQDAIDVANCQSADLVIPPGKYTCFNQLDLRVNSRIFGIQSPTIQCDPSNFPLNGTYNNLWSNEEFPQPFISTPEGAGNVLLDGLRILSKAGTDSKDPSAKGMIVFDWRCPARILNTQIKSARYSKACIRVGGNASGVLLNCFASTDYNGAYAVILGDQCNGSIDFAAVNVEHARHAGIQLKNCSNFNFLCPQSEHTGVYVKAEPGESSEPDPWAKEGKSDQPREIGLEDCKEIRFFNAAGGRTSNNLPDSAFVINNCESIFAFEPKYNWPDDGVAIILGAYKSYLHTARITQSYGSRIEEWIPFAKGLYAPSFGIKKRDSLVGRWTFDQTTETDSVVKDSVGINDVRGDYSSAVSDGEIQALGPASSSDPGAAAVIVPKDRMLDQESFSVSVRVKPISITTSEARIILNYDAEAAGHDWAIVMTPSGQVVGRSWCKDGNYARQDTPASESIMDGRWHEITLTYDADTQTARLYVDAVAVGSAKWDHRLEGRPRLNALFLGYILEYEPFKSAGLFDDLRFWNYTRSAEEIRMAGHWTFDPDPVTGSIVKDSAGINNVRGDYSNYSSAVTDGEIQALGPATSSDPGAAAVIVPKDRMLDQKSFSVSVRVKPLPITTSEARIILNYDAEAAGHDWAIVMTPSGQVVGRSWCKDGNYARQDTPASESIMDGRWHEITLTYDADTQTARLYVDAVAVGSTQWDHRLGGRPRLNALFLGYILEYEPFKSAGLFDDLRFWSYARSPQEIRLTGHWTFDSDPLTGSIVKDSAGINNVRSDYSNYSSAVRDGEIQALGPATSSDPGAAAVIVPKDRMLDQKSFSVSVRVKPIPITTSEARIILNYDAEAAGHDWAIVMTPSGQVVGRSWCKDGNYARQDTPASDSIMDGRWHEITLTYDADTQMARLYVDTVAVGSTKWDHRLEGRPKLNALILGYIMEYEPFKSAGSFDDLRFWSYALPEN